MYLFLALGYVTGITAIAEQLSLAITLCKRVQSREKSGGKPPAGRAKGNRLSFAARFRWDRKWPGWIPCVDGSLKGEAPPAPVGFTVVRLLGNPARHHIELRSGPEERPAHANDAAIAYVRSAIVSFGLCKDMDGRLFGKQRQV